MIYVVTATLSGALVFSIANVSLAKYGSTLGVLSLTYALFG